MASMEVVSLTDFISLRTRTYGTFKAKGVKITTGGCLCGRIKFEFTGEAFKTVSIFVFLLKENAVVTSHRCSVIASIAVG